MAEIDSNLDDIIRNAVEAKIQAAVLASLSGDEVMGKLVSTALQRPVEVPKENDRCSKVRIPFLAHVIEQAIRDATAAAVREYMVENADVLRAEVAKQMRKQSGTIAESLIESVVKVVEKPYGITVKLNMPSE